MLGLGVPTGTQGSGGGSRGDIGAIMEIKSFFGTTTDSGDFRLDVEGSIILMVFGTLSKGLRFGVVRLWCT